MTKFFLHGGGEMQRNEKHVGFFNSLIKEFPDPAKVLVVYFAMEKEEISQKHHVYEEYFHHNSNGKEIELKIATQENLIEEIERADAVYFRGGDTDKLIKTIKNYPTFKEELLKKEWVAGSSAGVYLFSKHAYSSSRNVMYTGLGILPIKCNCHYTKEKRGVIEKLKELPGGGEIVLLEEGEYKIIEVL